MIGLPSVTLVHKGNIMKFTEGGFKKWGYELAEREFGDAIASFYRPTVTGIIWERKKVHARLITVICNKLRKRRIVWAYEAIIIITCSSDLSGTWSGFNLVKNQLEMNNMYIYDSRQVGAPVMDMAFRPTETRFHPAHGHLSSL